MKSIQKLIHLKGFLARKEERPTVQGLGIQFFGDHSLYWTALFYNPISVLVKNILQDVKNISYFFLFSGRPLFKNEDHKFETLSKFSASAAIYRVGWDFAFFHSFLGVS